MVINDLEGFERMGYGFKVVNGLGRVGLGLDTDRIQEGLLLTLDDDGLLGVTVGTGANGIFLGSAPAGHEWTGLASGPALEAFQGLLVRRDGEIVHQVNAARHR